MNFRRRETERSMRINLTPLIDVVFLLLVFFMMTTTFNHESELQIDLPEARGEVSKKEVQPIRIIISQTGNYAVNSVEKRLVDRKVETLRRALLREINGLEPKPSLLISADAQAPHQAVMRAMEAARDAGFIHLNFEAQIPAAAEK